MEASSTNRNTRSSVRRICGATFSDKTIGRAQEVGNSLINPLTGCCGGNAASRASQALRALDPALPPQGVGIGLIRKNIVWVGQLSRGHVILEQRTPRCALGPIDPDQQKALTLSAFSWKPCWPPARGGKNSPAEAPILRNIPRRCEAQLRWTYQDETCW